MTMQLTRKNWVILVVGAALVSALLYGFLGWRAHRAKQEVLESLKAICPELSALARIDVSSPPAEQIKEMSRPFKAVIPVLGAGEKRLRACGLGQTELYGEIAQLLTGSLELVRWRKGESRKGLDLILESIHSSAVALAARCEQ